MPKKSYFKNDFIAAKGELVLASYSIIDRNKHLYVADPGNL
jgi:hypothetical protein